MKMIEDLGMIFPLPASNRKQHYAIYECPICEKHFRCNISKVTKGLRKSCGCIRHLTKYIHGMSYTNIYHKWLDMKGRCSPHNKSAKYYYNKGIKVCDNWVNNFMEFYDWAINNGYREGLELDRIDGNKGYCPENCRFVNDNLNSKNVSKLRTDNVSGFRGVSWNAQYGQWVTYITDHGQTYYLGHYKNKKQAAMAYNDFVLQHNTHHKLNLMSNE